MACSSLIACIRLSSIAANCLTSEKAFTNSTPTATAAAGAALWSAPEARSAHPLWKWESWKCWSRQGCTKDNDTCCSWISLHWQGAQSFCKHNSSGNQYDGDICTECMCQCAVVFTHDSSPACFTLTLHESNSMPHEYVICPIVCYLLDCTNLGSVTCCNVNTAPDSVRPCVSCKAPSSLSCTDCRDLEAAAFASLKSKGQTSVMSCSKARCSSFRSRPKTLTAPDCTPVPQQDRVSLQATEMPTTFDCTPTSQKMSLKEIAPIQYSRVPISNTFCVWISSCFRISCRLLWRDLPITALAFATVVARNSIWLLYGIWQCTQNEP